MRAALLAYFDAQEVGGEAWAGHVRTVAALEALPLELGGQPLIEK